MNFEQNDVFLEQDLAMVEQYLVKVLPGVKSKTYASMSANLKMCYYRLVQLSLGISKEHSFWYAEPSNLLELCKIKWIHSIMDGTKWLPGWYFTSTKVIEMFAIWNSHIMQMWSKMILKQMPLQSSKRYRQHILPYEGSCMRKCLV